MTETAKGKKYVRYKEGAEMYSMSVRSFEKIAKDAGAVHKIGGMVLVKVETIDRYLDSFQL